MFEPRKIVDARVLHLDMLDGWVIQIKTQRSGPYWHVPMEETTYGVLDSEEWNVYPTEEAAKARLAEIVNG